MMKIATMLFILFGSVHLFSQQIKFTGKVLEYGSKSPVSLAKVQVKSTSLGAITDMEGNFSLELDFSKGIENYVLVVKADSYIETEFILNRSNTSLIIEIKPALKNLNEVVVSSSRISERIFEAPVSIQKVSSKDYLSQRSIT